MLVLNEIVTIQYDAINTNITAFLRNASLTERQNYGIRVYCVHFKMQVVNGWMNPLWFYGHAKLKGEF